MREFILDGRRLVSEPAFWAEYLTVVQPDGAEYFGRNLAAFGDGVTGGPGWPGESCRIKIVNQTAAKITPDFPNTVAEIMRKAAGMELVRE